MKTPLFVVLIGCLLPAGARGDVRRLEPDDVYNLKDVGGVITMRTLVRTLAARGVDVATMAPRFGHFPILYVYGRSDLTAAFFGAKVSPADFESTILEHPVLAQAVGTFQFASVEDERVDRRLAIHLELAEGRTPESLGLSAAQLAAAFYHGLAKANQDFREVTRMFGPDALDVMLHAHGTGPFAGADIRLKQQYVKPGP